MDINAFFPTLIGSTTNNNHDTIEEELINHCLEISSKSDSGGSGWVSNKTYNTSDGKHEIFKDLKFSSLNNWVENCINEYCTQTKIDSSILSRNGSWFNIYRRSDYQEHHVHPTSVISAIYTLKCPEDGARIFFKSPINDMYYVKHTTETQQTVRQITCKSIPGTLIIFPSFLTHAVERHDSDEIRISLSYNFKQ
jgi:uncharacterized protein (TIGR02466 family)